MKNKITKENLPFLVEELKEEVAELRRFLAGSEVFQKHQKELLNIDEVAELLSLSKSSIYTKVSKRELPFIKQSRRLYFERSLIEAFLKEHRKSTYSELNCTPSTYLRGGSDV